MATVVTVSALCHLFLQLPPVSVGTPPLLAVHTLRALPAAPVKDDVPLWFLSSNACKPVTQAVHRCLAQRRDVSVALAEDDVLVVGARFGDLLHALRCRLGGACLLHVMEAGLAPACTQTQVQAAIVSVLHMFMYMSTQSRGGIMVHRTCTKG